MSELEQRLLTGLRDLLFTVEDELGPFADVSTAASIASDAWADHVDLRILPALSALYRAAFLAVSPAPSDASLEAFLTVRRPLLLAVPAQLFSEIQGAVADASLSGRGLLAAARDALDAASDSVWRPARVALTETTAAVNAATYDALLPDGGDVLWVAHDDARTRPSHAAADGQRRAVGEPFLVGDAPLRYPGDPLGPPSETVNCRCRLTPAPLLAGAPMPDETLPGTAPVYSGPPDGWRGCLAPLDTRSGDDRIIARSGDVPRSRPLPMEMQWQRESDSGHSGAVTAARIDRVWYDSHDGRDCLHGEGAFDLGGADGAELARRVAEGFAGQVSVDLVDVTAETRHYLAGQLIAEPDSMDRWLELIADPSYSEVVVATEWELAATTFVSVPAFGEARIEAVYGYTPDTSTLVAAVSGEHVFASADFAVPEPPAPTPLTICDDGRVYGHLATWGTCHVGFTNVCQQAPRSRHAYAYFHVGAVATDAGELPVGRITVGGGHAEPRGGVIPTLAHYDNAGSAVAVVRAVDGKHGVWVSGHLLPTARPADIAALRRSPLSGDWRRVAGSLELVAALAVNVPGFPVPRALAASIGPDQVSLVAAGAVPPSPPGPALDAATFVRDVLREMSHQSKLAVRAERLAQRIGLDPDSRAKALAVRVGRP